MPTANFVIGLEPKQAIDYLRQKNYLPTKFLGKNYLTQPLDELPLLVK